MAAGAGWAWIRAERGPVHVTGARGPRGPVTAIVERVPVVAPGDILRLDPAGARVWRTPAAPPLAAPGRVRDACDAVRPHLWNDPRALDLGRAPFEDLVRELAGRGPGLTPAGDDALLGYLLARRAADAPAVRHEAALVLAATRHATTAPSLALLRWAARGEAPEPAAGALAALAAADGGAIGPAVRRLTAYGRTTGPAILAGLVGGLTAGDRARRGGDSIPGP
jgi:uncharacterized protein DUF2877